MSSLHHDRLLVEGSGSLTGTTRTLPTPRGTSRRAVGDSGEKATSTAPTQRQGTAQRTGTAQSTAAAPAAPRATRASGAKAAALGGTLASRAKAATVKVATAKAATAKAATAKAATAARTAAVKTVANHTPAVRSARAAAAASAGRSTGSAKPATAKAAATKAAAPKPATAKAAATKTGTTAAKTAVARTATGAAAPKTSAPKTSAPKAPAAKPAASAEAPAPVTPAASKLTSSKPTTAKATTAKATTAKATPAKVATAKAATAKAAVVEPAVAKAAVVESAAAEPAAPKAAVVKQSAAKAAVVTPGAAQAPTASVAKASAVKAAARPTPYKRVSAAALTDLVPVADPAAPDASDVVVVKDIPAEPAPAATEPRLPLLFRRRPPLPRRRPAMYLAAALVGAISLAPFAPEESTAAATSTVSQSVSVAEQLGIKAGSADVVDAEATERLGELAVSRNARDAEQAAAAQVQAEANRIAAEAAAEAARPKAVLPVNGARLTSGFGARWGTLHAGIDLAAPMHTPEYAAMDGIVLEAGPASGFGLAVYIQHENGDVTVYGHMDEILVSAGQVVRAGDTIALLGNRGQSTGPHLHFEVHVGGIDGQKIDPLPWLRDKGVNI